MCWRKGVGGQRPFLLKTTKRGGGKASSYTRQDGGEEQSSKRAQASEYSRHNPNLSGGEDSVKRKEEYQKREKK